MKNENGINPKTLPAIKYCNGHRYFINLHPTCQSDLKGRFRVICSDCGAYGPWKKNVKAAIISWNEKYGVDLALNDMIR